jgi:hypothetical protein
MNKLEKMRAAALAEMRSKTSARDPKSARKLIAMSLPLKSALRKKMSRCGERDPEKDKRYDCERPSCPVCAERMGKRYFEKVLWPALSNSSVDDLRWVTVITHLANDLDAGTFAMAHHHRSLKHIIGSFGGAVRVCGRAAGAHPTLSVLMGIGDR